jgi:hypothetical protein
MKRMGMGIIFVILVLNLPGQSAQTMGQPEMAPDFGQIPLYFIPNQGQVGEEALFYAKTSRYTLWLTKKGMVFDSPAGVSRLMFIGASENPEVFPVNAAQHRVNYFIGNDPSKWHTDIATFKAARYRNIYPGIDLKIYGNESEIEYDWIVMPGGNADNIRFDFQDNNVELDAQGNLVVQTKYGAIVHKKPYSYQKISGEKVEVHSEFQEIDEGVFGFKLGAYNTKYKLFIDPFVLAYSTYLGGHHEDYGLGVAVDADGYCYAAGRTYSSSFPVTAGAFDTDHSTFDVFVTKFNSSGTGLVFSTFIGGIGKDMCKSITIDSSGNSYLTGTTYSSSYPVTSGAADTSFNGGLIDVFVTKLNSTGTALLYSTFLGGSSYDYGRDIALDPSGNAYVTGFTASSDFPASTGAFDEVKNNDYDTYVTKLDASGMYFSYSTYLGEDGADIGYGIAVDSSGNAYVSGVTDSNYFPVSTGAFDVSFNGERDAFLSKLNSSGSALHYSTFIGGTGDETGRDIDIDMDGNAYLTGKVSSTDFPLTQDAFDSHLDGTRDGYVTKVNSSGSGLIYSTYFGGSGDDDGTGIKVDSSGNMYFTGRTQSNDFPVTSGAYDTSWNGAHDGYLAKLSPSGTTLFYCTYFGGSGVDHFYHLTLDEYRNVYLTGQIDSSDFPTTTGAFDTSYNGSWDSFVVKFLYICDNVSSFNLLSPSNAASDQSIEVDLDWEDAANAESYDVYFGTTSPPPLAGNVLISEYDPGSLAYEQTYFWQVKAKNFCSDYTSAEWSFDTIHPPTITIEGNVTFNSSGLLGVTMTGLPGEPQTSDTGFYIDTVDYGWSGSATPALTGYNFTPVSRSYSNETENLTGQDYSAALNTYTISGAVWLRSFALPGVTMNGMPGTPETDGSGFYSDSVEYGWTGTVTPILAGYRFDPELRNYSDVADNYIDQDYEASGGFYSSPSNYQVIPEVLWAPATGGGTWMTEVQITDVTGGSEVSVYFNAATGERRGPFLIFTGSSPDTSFKSINLLNTLDLIDPGFDYNGTVGAAEFTTQDSDHLIHVIARTKNGNYSKTFPGLNHNNDNTAGGSRVMMIQNLVNNDTFRTAYGGFNPTDDSISVEYELMDGDGNTIGTTFTKTFTGRQYQALSVFNEAGVPYPTYSYENVWLKVNPTSGNGELMSYGATANNTTSDPAVHIAAQAQDIDGYNSPSNYQVIPEVLWAPATGGGTWMTEVQITDITGGSEVSVYFNAVTGERRGPITLFTGSGPGVSARTPNLLKTLDLLDSGFSYNGTVGTVEFVTQDESHLIQVMARTSNGNYSKTFQGLNVNEANTCAGLRILMVQNLVNDDSFRTAFGCFNPTDDEVTVEFTLMDANGSTIGTSFSKTFTGRQYQAFNPFTEAGVPYPGSSYNNTWIKVEVTSGSGQLMVYGATANNVTSDPAVHRAVQH